MPSEQLERANDFTPDARRMRAQQATAFVLDAIAKHLEARDRRYIAADLVEAFMGSGVEMVSDYTRQQMGLSPRGPKGWTDQELLAMEARSLEIMLRPPAFFVPTKDVNQG